MKIAIVSDDAKTISAHFGNALYYLVYTIENGKITGQETRNKPRHKQSKGKHIEGHRMCNRPSEAHHVSMMGLIMDCDVVLASGMGESAYDDLKIRSIQPIITDIREVQPALDAYLNGTLIDHLELLH
jgi:predicted Fe-Mo cluster-binding NifX family protein